MSKRAYFTAILLAACFGHALLPWSEAIGQAASGREFAALDELVRAGHYQEAQEILRKAPIAEDRKLDWLERRANDGHVPLQYELSARLHPRDLEASLKWYARAVLGYALDAALCANQSGAYGRFSQLVEPVRSDGIAKPHLLEAAIRAALEQTDLMEPRPWAERICFRGDKQFTREERLKARAEALADMKIEAQAFHLFAKAVELGRQRAFTVQDTKLTIYDSGNTSAGWLDDHRVLLIGGDVTGKTWREAYPQLFLWDTEKKAYERISSEGYSATTVCVDESTVKAIVYPEPRLFSSLRGTEKSLLLTGTFPDLRLRPVADYRAMGGPNHFGCTAQPPRPEGFAGAHMGWLRAGDGHLETHREDYGFDASVTLVKADGTRLPLPLNILSAGLLNGYAQWRNAYLLSGQWRFRSALNRIGRQRGDHPVLYWLYADGRTEEVVVPYGYWDEGGGSSNRSYRPTRRGLVIAGYRHERDDQPGFAGLYLFENFDTPVRVLPGIVNVLAVSPNGCNLAVTRAPYSNAARESRTINIVQLCERGAP